LHVVVFTRSTPDTAARVTVGANGAPSWDADLVVNPWDEYALEEAIVRAKALDGKAYAVTVGGDANTQSLRHAIGMGLDEAVRVEDAAVNPADSLAYATAAAAAVNKIGDVGLVIFGKESIDVGSDQHAYQTARKLGWPVISFVSKILSLEGGVIKAERMLDGGKQVVSATLPVVITVTKEINEPRYPSFIGIRKANKAVIPVWSLADLGAAAPAATLASQTFMPLPVRDIQTEFISGEPDEMAAKLVEKLLEEKVL
jgi:electron transfer flavoprotein beta subunit